MDKPIIFSAPMILALLDGRKTQTRRVLKYDKCGAPIMPILEGDRLWVREAHKALLMGDFPVLWYRADDSDKPIDAETFFAIESKGWRSPIHMPRWASRLTLTVTDVRVQMVQEISEVDAAAEGVQSSTKFPFEGPGRLERFEALWNSIHGPDAWDRNDWVAAYTFTVDRRNIDQ